MEGRKKKNRQLKPILRPKKYIQWMGVCKRMVHSLNLLHTCWACCTQYTGSKFFFSILSFVLTRFLQWRSSPLSASPGHPVRWIHFTFRYLGTRRELNLVTSPPNGQLSTRDSLGRLATPHFPPKPSARFTHNSSAFGHLRPAHR